MYKLYFLIVCVILEFQILAFDETKEKIFKSMKRLHDHINTTTAATGVNYAYFTKLEGDVNDVQNALKEANEGIKTHRNNKKEFGIDAKVLGEWQSLTNQKISDLWNELGNTTDNIMDKMFEKDDVIGKKMKEYDNKILNIRNEYNTLEAEILSLDQASKDAMTKTEEQVS